MKSPFGAGSGRKRERTAAEREALLMVELPGSTVESAKASANSIVEAIKHGLNPVDAEMLTKAVGVVMRGAAADRHAQTIAEMRRLLAEARDLRLQGEARVVADRQHLGGEDHPIDEYDPGDPPLN